MERIRIGLGYDIHRLIGGRRLVLGSVDIPHDKGLAGHSDADVLLHAITDAILGAAGLPDIGEMFPDTDPAHQNADSAGFLRDAMKRVQNLGYQIANIDVVVHAEAPKLSEYKRPIADSVAGIIGINSDCVSIKAKTQEGMGFIGAGEAIGCTAVALLVGSPVVPKEQDS